MTKKEFIAGLGEKVKNVKRRDLINIYDNFLMLIINTVKKEGKIGFTGFGTFKKLKRKETIKINPKTKQKMKISAKNVLRFKASKSITL